MHNAEYFKKISSKESNSRLRNRYLALYHFKKGVSRTKIANYLCVSRTSVNEWVSKYLTGGLDSLKDRNIPGRPPKLTNAQLEQLSKYIKLNNVKINGGRLIAEDIQIYIKDEFGVQYQIANIYRLLHSLDFSWITSRSKHPKQSIEAQESFKKIQIRNDH
jgi:transposase